MSEMTDTILDFTKVDDGYLEDGEYEGVVLGAVKTVRNDKPSIYFKLKINGKIYPSRHYSLSEKALSFLKGAFRNLGLGIGREKVNLDDLIASVRGRKAIFKVAPDEYNGKTYRHITPVKYLGKLTDEEMLSLEGAPF